MARTFAANRDIKIEASETGAGIFTLRTRGLADRRRPELEIAGVPEAALNGAGGVINVVAEYTVNEAEVLADQTVGNVLTVGEGGRRHVLAVRAVGVEAAKGGLWSKLTGSASKGVLRLVEISDGPPLTAIATMLVHRAVVRLAKDDEAGAREELAAAIAVFPGEAGAGEAPSIDGVEGVYNWQNYLAYLELARLGGDDVEEGAARFGEALARSFELAREELGATLDELAALDEPAITGAAARILEHNLGALHRGAGDTPGMMTIASPIWEVVDGATARRASLLPSALVSLYYEGASAERLRREGASVVTTILARDRASLWRPAWIARDTRRLWISEEAPLLEPIAAALPGDGLVSLVLADVARCFQAGATASEIDARYGARGEEPSAELASLDRKLETLGAWEADQYIKAMGA
jgi:hypothetical protein